MPLLLIDTGHGDKVPHEMRKVIQLPPELIDLLAWLVDRDGGACAHPEFIGESGVGMCSSHPQCLIHIAVPAETPADQSGPGNGAHDSGSSSPQSGGGKGAACHD